MCLVGVDGSDGSRAALRWAYSFAAAMGNRLCVVRAWEYPSMAILPGRSALRAPDEVDAVIAAELTDFVRESLGADADHADVMAELILAGVTVEKVIERLISRLESVPVVGWKSCPDLNGHQTGASCPPTAWEGESPVRGPALRSPA